jgi:hypothetical protein
LWSNSGVKLALICQYFWRARGCVGEPVRVR